MNTAELTELHTETIAEARRARTLANIARRAETLFSDGYTITARRNGQYDTRFTVMTPNTDFYGVCVEKAEAFGDYCTCKAFAEYKTCKHLQACRLLLDAEAAEDAQADAEAQREDEARTFFAEQAARY